MIGLLDPAFFLPRVGDKETAEFVSEMNSVLRACRDYNIRLPTLEEYWNPLWTNLVRPLEGSLPPDQKAVVHELRKRGERFNRSILPAKVSAADEAGQSPWRTGLNTLFDFGSLKKPVDVANKLPATWLDLMQKAILWTLGGSEPVVLFTRRIDGRNLKTHQAARSVIRENTCWRLSFESEDGQLCEVRCIHHPRNLQVPWTSRFDWKLPATIDGAKYPFCPPENWSRDEVRAVQTHESKPCWIDKPGNGWARPDTPGTSHHWDVFISVPKLQERIGVSQINVVEFSSVEGQKSGDIHHMPGTKQSSINDVGWTCK